MKIAKREKHSTRYQTIRKQQRDRFEPFAGAQHQAVHVASDEPGIPLAYATAHRMMCTRANVAADDTVLVLGAERLMEDREVFGKIVLTP